MKRVDMGNVYLLGPDWDVWSKADASDLIAINARYSDDLFTAWVTEKAVLWWHQIIGKHLKVKVLFSQSKL